jgi:hypothetical protein
MSQFHGVIVEELSGVHRPERITRYKRYKVMWANNQLATMFEDGLEVVSESR